LSWTEVGTIANYVLKTQCTRGLGVLSRAWDGLKLSVQEAREKAANGNDDSDLNISDFLET
jgi:hypothetical protein